MTIGVMRMAFYTPRCSLTLLMLCFRYPSMCDHRVLRGSSLTAQFPLGPAQAPFAKGHLDNDRVTTVIDPGVLRAFLIPLP